MVAVLNLKPHEDGSGSPRRLCGYDEQVSRESSSSTVCLTWPEVSCVMMDYRGAGYVKGIR